MILQNPNTMFGVVLCLKGIRGLQRMHKTPQQKLYRHMWCYINFWMVEVHFWLPNTNLVWTWYSVMVMNHFTTIGCKLQLGEVHY